ncbi:hypothetical protein [Lacibacter sp. H407]|uniref:hypothetical protein n=1 Tax=Lacibacter sp. H407 TaxID=3133423 RepID=UPI0030BC4932
MIRTKREDIRLSLTHAMKSSMHSWLLQPNRNGMPNSYVIDFIHKRPDCIHT